jgi:hypothetical protein
MNSLAVVFLLANAVALLVVPRRWAPLPLLAVACYMTLGQGVEVGLFSFPVIRLVLLVGFVRVVFRHERLVGGLNSLDKVMLVWGVWLVFTGLVLHPLVGQLGTVYNMLGSYFLIRILCHDFEDVVHLVKIMALILVPVALEMVNEQLTGHNWFGFLGGVPETVVVRNDGLRAQGPFRHAILAGTVGAACCPLLIGLWLRHSVAATFGVAACLTMVFASASSGPITSMLCGLFALGLWKWRQYTRYMRIAAVVGYLLLDIVMKAPAYYLITRIDFTGSSTGWHRAELIKQTIAHLSEWWIVGTLYTRHWMATGVSWSPDHADITSQYIGYAVGGGLMSVGLFVLALGVSFDYVGRAMRAEVNGSVDRQKFIWAIGAALFAQAASCVSVSYFDQSFVFLFLNLAIIGSLWSSTMTCEAKRIDRDLNIGEMTSVGSR